ncbi:MAG: hypothetical protein ABIN67_12100 [Ferruginibacter sp.]
MGNNKDGIGDGILKGLKKILFTNSPDEPQEPTTPTVSSAPIIAETKTAAPVDDAGGNVKDMKLRIYQLLESINKPGCDFFEVWNASIEMGGANSNNIKAAFTSLKYVDKSLNKDKLLETGDFYISNLVKVLEAEATKRKEEKDKLLVQKEQQKTNLSAEITDLERQIVALQNKLAEKKKESDSINEKYQPLISEIDHKITNGQQAVNSVVNEMQQVISIIQKELN